MTLAAELDSAAWETHAAGEGTKGLRLYDWARSPLSSRPTGEEHWLFDPSVPQGSAKTDLLFCLLRRRAQALPRWLAPQDYAGRLKNASKGEGRSWSRPL